MDNKRLVEISKYLSLHLRHQPERIGLALGEGGWVDVDTLLAAASGDDFPITKAELLEVVADNDKKRFSFNEDGTLIRANQGHTAEVDLQLEPQIPPDMLYHGTATRFLASIMTEGLKKMSWHHVHMTTNLKTAKSCGARYGVPVILTIDALGMHTEGTKFYCSDNGVWLVEHVPVVRLGKL